MAKTAIDYYDDGSLLFIRNQPRPAGTSWQAKAGQEGWDNAKMAKEQPKEYKRKINKIDIWRMDKELQKISDSSSAVNEHITQLMAKAVDRQSTNLNAAKRYMNKVMKLQFKHRNILTK